MKKIYEIIKEIKENPQVLFVFLLLSIWLLVFTLTRSVLFFHSMTDWISHTSLGSSLAVFWKGLLFDAGFLSYAAVPMAAILLAIPTRYINRTLLSAIMMASVFFMLFFSASEWFFWDEFGSRFNFIAVDYLVYSDEVIHNIWESYPLPAILSVLALLATGITLASQRAILRVLQFPPATGAKQKISTGFFLLIPAIVAFTLLGQEMRGDSGNTYLKELSGNGPYQFFAAFRDNTLDYDQFYANLPVADVAGALRDEIAEPGSHFTSNNPIDIRRSIDNTGPTRKYNVVLVTIESFSAKYMGSFGDKRGLTPHLDALREQSLFFNNFYATGTRTDRGLEAVTLSIPPTPGRSIVKRIGHETGYGSLGQQLAAQGYDSVFVYGGRGYFDNMNAFFSGNGYRIVDQSSVPESAIHFKNAWGMADEDLYSLAVTVADADYQKQQPFFMHIMTTSNHRPYTYPDGRIDIPSGSGRDGAVKYTDYAISRFLAEARTKPWFDNTLFVFLADHCAGSAGKEDLPVKNYHIPLWVYAPGLVPAQESSQLASQIDVAPTIMGLLNIDYTSTFFGRNLLLHNTARPRVLIGNYQHLGLFDGKDLAILSPNNGIRKHLDALGDSKETIAVHDDPLIMRAISYYQSASTAYKEHWLAWQTPALLPLAHESHTAFHNNTGSDEAL